MSIELVNALFYIVDNDISYNDQSTGAFAAMAAVNLIGRNEGGLTLTRQAIARVVDIFQSYFDASSRRSSYLVNKLLRETKPILHMIVPDANKAYVIEHEGALDSLVAGLLLDQSNPRRDQEGAAELQQMCALVLQNLALSQISADSLRAHAGVMKALRQLASSSSGAAKSE